MNEALNGLPVSLSIHNGSHSLYNTKVLNELENIKIQYGPSLTPEIAKQKLAEFIQRIKTEMINNPNSPVNDLNF